MENQVISSQCVTLLIHNGAGLSRAEAEELVRCALTLGGFSQWSGMSIHMFTGGGDALLMAVPAGGCSAFIADYALPFFEEYFTE